MKYIINGVDIQAVFGVTITNGVNVFMQLPDRKASVSTDFEDEDGIDIDLSTPKFSARTFSFDCTIVGDDMTDFKNKYFGLFQLLRQQDTYTMYNDYLDMTLGVFYQKQTGLSPMNYVAGAKIAQTFQLVFGEADPFSNIPIVELVDDGNNVLVP